jgi:hypothetical protein
MTRLRQFILGLAVLAWGCTAAVGQVPNSLQPNSVIGRLGVGPGPAQAIPFSILGTAIVPYLPGVGGITYPAAPLAVGDLLYAPTTTTVGRLADVALGSVLCSGGVGVAPNYCSTLPAGVGRTILSTNTTYYVGTDGNDACNGLTNAGGSSGNCAFGTLAHAMAVITGQIDFAAHTVTLQCRTSHCSYTTQLLITPWVGGGNFIFDGGGGTINYTAVTAADGAVYVTGGGMPGGVTIQNVTVETSAGTGGFVGNLLVQANGVVTVGTGVTFGPCALTAQIVTATGGANVSIPNSFTVSAGGCNSMIYNNGGAISTGNVSMSVTFSTAVSYGLVMNSVAPSFTYVGGMSFVNPSNVTATRFSVSRNGVLAGTGGNLSFFPGSGCATLAACTSTGGQYL